MTTPEREATLQRMTNFRWVICAMLFAATTVNYMDRQVLSLTWKNFIAPEFHWTDANYGDVAGVFSLVYAIANVFSGRFIDWLGTKKGYLWAIGIWSGGACLHALCGWATEEVVGVSDAAELVGAAGGLASTVALVSVWFFMGARMVLAIGESGNFPAAVKVTAEYFPKKDRAFATAIFNSGTTVGAIIAPLCIPSLASYFKGIGLGNGWEVAFVVIGLLGFLWMGLWMWLYRDINHNPHVNQAERDYISQAAPEDADTQAQPSHKLSLKECLQKRQTWAILGGKFLTDGVWWFLLFWTPAYLNDVYGLSSDNPTAQILIAVVYIISMLSIFGGKLPTVFIRQTGKDAYSCRMRAMFIFACVPLLCIAAQPLGQYSYWWPVLIIGIVAAAHQSWSANLFTVGSDLFPGGTLASITGLNGMAGGISSLIINKFSGMLFTYAGETNMQFLSFEGKEAGYFIVFCWCAVAYLLGWTVMKTLVPKYKPVR